MFRLACRSDNRSGAEVGRKFPSPRESPYKDPVTPYGIGEFMRGVGLGLCFVRCFVGLRLAASYAVLLLRLITVVHTIADYGLRYNMPRWPWVRNII